MAGTLTFLFGIPYGIVQYIEENKITASPRRLTCLSNSIQRRILNIVSRCLQAAENKKQIAEASKSLQALRQIVLAVVDAKKIETELLLLMDFFDGVAVCVITDLCDADTTGETVLQQGARSTSISSITSSSHRQTIAGAKFGIGLKPWRRLAEKLLVAFLAAVELESPTLLASLNLLHSRQWL